MGKLIYSRTAVLTKLLHRATGIHLTYQWCEQKKLVTRLQKNHAMISVHKVKKTGIICGVQSLGRDGGRRWVTERELLENSVEQIILTFLTSFGWHPCVHYGNSPSCRLTTVYFSVYVTEKMLIQMLIQKLLVISLLKLKPFNRILTHAITWMAPEDVMLSETSQS